MSIRPEDAARQASRFSLRTAFLGSSDVPQPPPQQSIAAIPRYYSHQVATPQIPAAAIQTAGTPLLRQAPAVSQSQGLTFGSIVGKAGIGANGGSSGAPQPNNGMSNTAVEAMRKIAEIQRMNATGQNEESRPVSFTKSAHSSNFNRVLQSGYINGGSTNTDASAEIMRLTGLVDSMNGKLVMQSERLQRTEASLVKANRAMTSERATHNGRMLKMQGDLKGLQASEAKLKEKLSSETAFKTNKTTSFEEAVRKSEEIDAKLQAYEAQITELTSQLSELQRVKIDTEQTANAFKLERDDFSTKLAFEKERSIEREQMLVAVSEERDKAVASTEAAIAASAESAVDTARQLELEQKLSEMTVKHDELVEEKARFAREELKTAAACDAHDSLMVEKDTLLVEIAQMTSERDEALKTVESLTTELSIQRSQAAAAESAASEIELLSKRIEEEKPAVLFPQSTGCGNYDEMDEDTEEESDGEEVGFKHPYGSSYHDKRFYNNIGHKSAQMPTKLFLQSDSLRKRSKPVGTFKSTLHSLFDSHQRTRPAIAKAIPPWVESKLCISSSFVSCTDGNQIDNAALTTPTDTSVSSHNESMQVKIQKLVHAVSADITQTVLQQRRTYLSASGMNQKDIDADIVALTPAAA